MCSCLWVKCIFSQIALFSIYLRCALSCNSAISVDEWKMNNALLSELDIALNEFTSQFKPPIIDFLPKFSTDDNFHGSRHPRSPCPSGVGRFGFNSFNFLTFMVMVFNAVANVNNNINNNNNNNNDINLNSISQAYMSCLWVCATKLKWNSHFKITLWK